MASNSTPLASESQFATKRHKKHKSGPISGTIRALRGWLSQDATAVSSRKFFGRTKYELSQASPCRFIEHRHSWSARDRSRRRAGHDGAGTWLSNRLFGRLHGGIQRRFPERRPRF